MAYLETYYDEIKKGNIIVGQDMKDELNNLIEDLKSDKWIYDTKDFEFRKEFMETFVKLTKSPFYGQQMKLMLWQCAWLECLLSFKNKETGRRRFKKTLLEIARKNAKTETCNAISLSELMIGNDGSDIVVSSNDDSQASILYDGINVMREMFDSKNKRTHKNQSFIKNKKTGTRIFKLSDRTRNKEGRNIDIGIVDEVHEMKTNVIVKSIETSQSTKEEPLLILITTEGFVFDGYLDKELKYAKQVINKEIPDDTYLPWLYTQDNETEIWQDENSWYKSNPSLGIVKSWDYLRDQLNRAKYDKAERMFILSKDFNIKQNSSESWLLEQDVEYVQDEIELEQFRRMYCLGAVDLSATTDLSCAKILLMRPNDSKKYIFTKYFIPETKLSDSDDKTAGAKYEEWARAGYLDIHEGTSVNLSKVAEWFKELWDKYEIAVFKLGYDQRFAKDFLSVMESYGYGNKKGETCEMINQSKYVMSLPIKLFEAELKAQNIQGINEMDKWCLLNACIEIDNQQMVMLVKSSNDKKIDGAITNCLLMAILERYRTEYSKAVAGIR